MQQNKTSNHAPQNLADILPDKAESKRAFWRWLFAALVVFVLYGLVFLYLYKSPSEEEHLVGSSAALMIDFAPEPTAPAIESEQQVVQQEKNPEPTPEQQNIDDEQLDEPKQAEPEQQPQTTSETEKPVEKAQQLAQQLPAKTDNKKSQKVEKPQPSKHIDKRHQNKHHRKSSHRKTEIGNQQAAAPSIDAKNGKNFAAPKTNKNTGFNGKSEKVWTDLVYRKIQRVARRMQRQLPGARGVSYVAFSYDADGRITATRTVKSSGNDRIDALAVRIVKAASPLPKPEAEGIKTVPIRVN